MGTALLLFVCVFSSFLFLAVTVTQHLLSTAEKRVWMLRSMHSRYALFDYNGDICRLYECSNTDKRQKIYHMLDGKYLCMCVFLSPAMSNQSHSRSKQMSRIKTNSLPQYHQTRQYRPIVRWTKRLKKKISIALAYGCRSLAVVKI